MQLKNIYFDYDGLKIFENFSLKIKTGQFVCLMGDNGSGKTTLLKILAGLLFPKKGSYYLEKQKIDQNYLKSSVHEKNFHQKVGYLFQNSEVQLFNNTVIDEIDYGPRQMGLSELQVKQRSNDILKLLQIESLRARNSTHLSGGEKKMVALGSMLALNPDYLLLDEPFNDLTRKNSFLISEIFRKLHQAGKTIILSCHEPFHVRNDITELIVLKNHKLIYQGKMLAVNKIDKLI